ncbi:MAG: hypothetical protein DRR42_17810 [Gammaproteobacteria bacterium]|nr:MAG: hypothetical protein DRR42_17810 [Gammaproteobacteria bacterium]
MIQVSVSILNYNSTRNTIACMKSLLADCHEADVAYGLDVFVADNNSTYDEQLQLQQSIEKLPNIHLLLNSENRGFAAGHNLNLNEIFLRSNPDFVWILNNDCIVYRESLSSLIKSSQQHPEVGIWGATLLEPDGETIQCAGGCLYNSWVSSYRQCGRGKALSQIADIKPVNYDYIAGASLFFPVATLQKGLDSARLLPSKADADTQQWLNESFFLYFEELDLAWRLKPGLEMAWCKDAMIKHAGGASTGTDDNQRSELAEYHSTLSALKFTRLYYPRRLWFMMPARYLAKFLQLSIKGRFYLLSPLTRAYKDYLLLKISS